MTPFNLCIDGHNYIFSSQDALDKKISELFFKVKKSKLDSYFEANKGLYWDDVDDILNGAYNGVHWSLISLVRGKFNHVTENSWTVSNFAGYLMKSMRYACYATLKNLRRVGVADKKGPRITVNENDLSEEDKALIVEFDHFLNNNNPLPTIRNLDTVNENDLPEEDIEEFRSHLLEIIEAYKSAPLPEHENPERRKRNCKWLIEIHYHDYDNDDLASFWGLSDDATRQRKKRSLDELIIWGRENRHCLYN
jgi:hypothetical protein